MERSVDASGLLVEVIRTFELGPACPAAFLEETQQLPSNGTALPNTSSSRATSSSPRLARANDRHDAERLGAERDDVGVVVLTGGVVRFIGRRRAGEPADG